MIDIVFLLLIFFLVTWQFTRSEQDNKVQIPTAAHGKETQRRYRQIFINVRENGDIVVDQQVISSGQLLSKLEAIVAAAPDQPVTLRGDGKAEYQQMMNVIDTCSEAGVWNISFRTQRPQP